MVDRPDFKKRLGGQSGYPDRAQAWRRGFPGAAGPARPVPGMAIDARRDGGGWVGRFLCLTAMILAAGAVLLHGYLSQSPLWTVRTIEIEGNRSMTREDLLDRLDLEVGMSWWQIPYASADELTLAEPRLVSVEVAYDFPRGLQVEVAERQGVLLLVGEPMFALAEDGRIIETDAQLDPTDLPCLTGQIPTVSDPEDPLSSIVNAEWWAQLMEIRAEQPELWGSISQIDFESERRFRIFFRSCRRLLLWDPVLNDHLWAQIPRILDSLAERDLDDDIVLDMRFRDRVVVRYPEDRLKNPEEEPMPFTGEDATRYSSPARTSESQKGDQV